jgi:3-methyl-2-oxobutanoate hydroxymethyltransferase
MAKRTTTHDLRKLYEADTPITMVTCYDYTFARLVQRAEIDTILIGDSLGNVIQGQETTLPVTVDDIVYHSRAVHRGNGSALIVADMPFMSYQASHEDGMRNAGRLLKEGGAQAVKVEGGRSIASLVEKMTSQGIPVVGHLGLTPQSVHKFGGYRVQGRGEEAGDELLEDAKALETAGVFMLVLEMVPKELARQVTEALSIPTIGIGAGNGTSGQVLVLQDLLGMNQSFKPKFLKNFADLEKTVTEALSTYRDEVRQRVYPGDEHSFD